MILITISQFVTLSEFPNFLQLNKTCYTHLKHSKVYKARLIEYLSKFLKTSLSQDTYKSFTLSTTSIVLQDELSILTHFKSSQNFIPNPCGNFGFEGWEVKNQNEEGWTILSDFYYKDYKTCFAGSFEWCDLIFSSDVEEPADGKRKALIAGSPVCRHSACPAKAKITMIIRNRDKGLDRVKEVMISVAYDRIDENDKEFPWQLLSICMELKPGDRNVTVIFGGMDELFWKDNYGPRFGYCYLREVFI
jgi:hypothetical protein